ncbi:alpha/beta fold hydrolase [Candidatus Peregrinibacteria bacterium]|nr:alpha/beta fold hydrolase [Candidatus Peregrinibacteria bacterium]
MFSHHSQKNPALVCLHGWGGSKESFTELRTALKHTAKDIEIFTPDLPGFGSEPEPSRPWTTDDYADWFVQYLRNNNLLDRELILLGHSHGGRILIKLLSKETKNQKPKTKNLRIKRLILCSSAGIRHPRHFKRMLGLMLAKTGKFFLTIPGLRALQPLGKKFLYKLVRVHDYEKASPIMRDTLMRVTAEDLRDLLPSIDVPTDIFWGTEDRMTPVSDAHLMKSLIPGSRLRLFSGVRHSVHRERAREIAGMF